VTDKTNGNILDAKSIMADLQKTKPNLFDEEEAA
jgi:hypothetical protein